MAGRCRPWSAAGGKSRAYFVKTADDRFIVKQLQASEKRSVQEIAPSYFRYLAQTFRRSAPTCLAKILGMYTVRCTLQCFLHACSHTALKGS